MEPDSYGLPWILASSILYQTVKKLHDPIPNRSQRSRVLVKLGELSLDATPKPIGGKHDRVRFSEPTDKRCQGGRYGLDQIISRSADDCIGEVSCDWVFNGAACAFTGTPNRRTYIFAEALAPWDARSGMEDRRRA